MTEPMHAGPVRAQERIQLLDVLRGFALLGILQVNFITKKGVLGDLLTFFIDGSFYPIFCFLFGLGFAVQLIRAEERRRPFVLRYLWRTILLFVIGAAHFVFIWRGDILRDYAQVAVLLLVVRRWRPWLLIGLAVAALALYSYPIPAEGRLWRRANREYADSVALRSDMEAQRRSDHLELRATVDEDGGYWRGVRAASQDLLGEIRQDVTIQRLHGFAVYGCMFLLGLYVGRRRLLHEPQRHTRQWEYLAAISFVIGVTGNTFQVLGDFLGSKSVRLPAFVTDYGLERTLGDIGLSIFYISGVTLLFTHRAQVKRLLAPLVYVGRMALTNYLVQSVIMTTLLFGRGFGLGAYADGWARLPILEAVFIGQVLYSRWWLARFQFGPVEWAWRSLTWFRLMPMRVAPPAAFALAPEPAPSAE